MTIGGIDLAVSSYSPHPTLAEQAVLCLRNAQNQLTAAVKGGLPPTLASVYNDPQMQSAYPFRKLILAQVNDGGGAAQDAALPGRVGDDLAPRSRLRLGSIDPAEKSLTRAAG